MNKIFLSHSSTDKPYVSYIANQFGKDHCTYDAACFEAGMKNLDEIFREMDKSSIFVVFISDASLESDWVKKELSIADERLHHDAYKLSQIFPIIIDPSITHSNVVRSCSRLSSWITFAFCSCVALLPKPRLAIFLDTHSLLSAAGLLSTDPLRLLLEI